MSIMMRSVGYPIDQTTSTKLTLVLSNQMPPSLRPHCVQNSNVEQKLSQSFVTNMPKYEVAVHKAAQRKDLRVRGWDKQKRSTIAPPKGSEKSSFVEILYAILESGKHDELIRWHDEDSSFVVWNSIKFSEEVLPLYYTHRNFASFERQTNFYGFKKMGVHDTEPTKKRLKRGDPVKFKHLNFYKGNANIVETVARISCPKIHRQLTQCIRQSQLDIAAMKNENLEKQKEVTSLIYEIIYSTDAAGLDSPGQSSDI